MFFGPSKRLLLFTFFKIYLESLLFQSFDMQSGQILSSIRTCILMQNLTTHLASCFVAVVFINDMIHSESFYNNNGAVYNNWKLHHFII